jgi:hypothetical protein
MMRITFTCRAAAGPSYREAKGGPFDFFHHKRAVSTITDI